MSPGAPPPELEGDLAGFDPFDPAQQGTHHPKMAQLRERCPVARLDSGMSILTRFDDVRTALAGRNMRNSHSGRAPGVFVPPEDRLFFFEYDPPEHVPLRQLVLDLLSRQSAARQAPFIHALVEELLAPVVETGHGEIVSQLSVPLAGRMMMRIAGFPAEDALRWRAWIKDMVISRFSFTNRNERGVGYEECYPDQLAYLDEHIAQRAAAIEDSADPASLPDDALTRVLTARIDGQPLSHTIKRMILASVVAGGSNTLVNFVSNTVLSLARDPEAFAALRADRTLVPVAVEESLRRDAPSMFITRICAEDMEIGGASFRAGDKVLVGLASANRDERAYPQAEEFRLDRTDPEAHVAFGWGSHLCLGVHVARQVGWTMLETFLDVVEALEVEPGTTPAPYLSIQGNGLDELFVRVTPALTTRPMNGASPMTGAQASLER